MFRPRRSSLALALIPIAAGQAPGTEPPAFVPLGDIEPESIMSVAGAISADGLVVTGYCTPTNQQRVFRWTQPGGMINLNGPNLAIGVGANADGSVLVCNASTLSGNALAYRWSAPTGFVALSALPSGSWGPRVFGVSADGDIAVGDSSAPLTGTAVRWVSSTVAVPLSNEPGFASWTARGISADGTVVVGGGVSTALGAVAFRWTEAGGTIALADLDGGSVSASAFAVSADGSTIVGYGTSSLGQEATVWQSGVPLGLGDFAGGAVESSALAMSASGTIVVGYGTTDLGEEAFVWDDRNGLRSLKQQLEGLGVTNLAGWTLNRATGVSGSGKVIVGYGRNPDGRIEAWRATISVPCYANCDGSLKDPILSANDFLCFLTNYVTGQSYANCDGSTLIPILNINDFQCYINRFSEGCP